MKCKPYSEITVEIRTQLKPVKITSNRFAVCVRGLDCRQDPILLNLIYRPKTEIPNLNGL